MKKKIVVGIRLLLGMLFLVFGLNKFFWFLPMPAPAPEAGAFFGALMATGYFMKLLPTVEVISGVLLLSNFFVPLALTLLAPIIVNILFFHLFMDLSGLPLALVITAMEIFLAYSYRNHFKTVLVQKAELTESLTMEGVK